MVWGPNSHKKGRKVSAATRAKLSAAAKKRKGTHHKGHPMSAATKAKISAALKGKHHAGHHMSAATKAKISAALKGKHHAGHHMSAETRAKISAALRARHPGGPKQRVNITGRHLSAAARAKISAALKGRHHTKGTTHPAATSGHGTRHRGVGPVHHVMHGLKFHHVTARTSKRRVHMGSRKSLISSATHHTYKGFVHTKTRHKRYHPVLHRKTRAHRVWHRRRRK
jgi:hypothetical protein